LKAIEPFVVNDERNFSILDLVDENNDFHKEVKTTDAIERSMQVGLDLVCFSGETKNHNPLCKILDYGRWKYQKEKKNKKLQKEQKHETKEIRFSPNINDHDVEHKVKHAQEFIESGHEVDFTMKLRRRANKNLAKNRMQEIVERCKSFSIVKSEKYDFNFISVKLSKK